MQTTENKIEVLMSPAPAEPISEPLHLTEEEADEIFRLAEAEIQPLLRKAAREKWTGRLQAAFCLLMMLVSIIGLVWQVVIYPKTTVTLFPVQKSITITTTVSLPTRTLAPVTLTRSASTAATGHGHLDARSAAGTLTFYNGLFTPQYIASGTVFTGRSGVKVTTDQAVTIPPANPPQFSEATITAYVLTTGQQGNINAGEISTTLTNGVLVKNDQFTGGRDARDYTAVSQQDIQHLTATLQQRLTQAMPQAFQLAQGEALYLTHCQFIYRPSHRIGDEATTITLHASYTCQGHAYNRQELTTRTTAVFNTRTRPGAHYQLFGTVHGQVTSVSPLTVSVSGIWVYTLSTDYEQFLAEKIAGDTPQQARAYLLKTGVISQASIPNTLPQETMYINFLVLIEI